MDAKWTPLNSTSFVTYRKEAGSKTNFKQKVYSEDQM